MDKPVPDPNTVKEIVDLTTSKCFDWAQGCIAETMAAVAAELVTQSVTIKHELMEEDAKTS